MAWKKKTDLNGVEMTPELLRQYVAYDPESGHFTHVRQGRGITHGSVAGCLTEHGYRLISIERNKFNAGRLAWFYMIGAWPAGDIDHINGDKTDNRWSNLRDATKFVNMHNYRKPNANNATGVLGVHFHKQSGKWRAKLKVAGKAVFDKLYADIEDAKAAYLEAKRKHHADGCTI